MPTSDKNTLLLSSSSRYLRSLYMLWSRKLAVLVWLTDLDQHFRIPEQSYGVPCITPLPALTARLSARSLHYCVSWLRPSGRWCLWCQSTQCRMAAGGWTAPASAEPLPAACPTFLSTLESARRDLYWCRTLHPIAVAEIQGWFIRAPYTVSRTHRMGNASGVKMFLSLHFYSAVN